MNLTSFGFWDVIKYVWVRTKWKHFLIGRVCRHHCPFYRQSHEKTPGRFVSFATKWYIKHCIKIESIISSQPAISLKTHTGGVNFWQDKASYFECRLNKNTLRWLGYWIAKVRIYTGEKPKSLLAVKGLRNTILWIISISYRNEIMISILQSCVTQHTLSFIGTK